MHTLFTVESNIPHQEALLALINDCTDFYNKDNISRTEAYFSFFQRYPEIKWSFLASMVSRNAGWNMCDLEGSILSKSLSDEYRKRLFLTYETANAIIFRDVFPQLLLYHYSTQLQTFLFHLLPHFFTSKFMQLEWKEFWDMRDEDRLMTALIINEQNCIQKPVIEGALFQEYVFKSPLFFFQDLLHFSTVLFPTLNGELYGASVHHFRKVDQRIELGKTLGEILFSADLFPSFYAFAKSTEHTGSRHDYEQYYPFYKQRETPFLRVIYPFMDVSAMIKGNWERYQPVKPMWWKKGKLPKERNITGWFEKKQKQYRLLAAFIDMRK